MGLFRSRSLRPVQPPVGFHSSLFAQAPTTLVFKEGTLAYNSDVSVHDSDGTMVVQCRRPESPQRGCRVIADRDEQELYHIRSDLATVPKTYVAIDTDGEELWRIEQQFKIGLKLKVTFMDDSTGSNTSLALKGDFTDGSVDLVILPEGQVVAHVRRQKYNPKQLFADRPSFSVDVAVGVDLAFVAGICLCFDDANNDVNGRGGLQGGSSLFNSAINTQ